MICKCINWCRTDGRRTDHHPNCKEFKEALFIRVNPQGFNSYLIPFEDGKSILDDMNDDEMGKVWGISLVKMTIEEYENLLEFQGF